MFVNPHVTPPHLHLSFSVYCRRSLCPQAVPSENHEVPKSITCSTQSVCSVSHTTTSANICSLQREHHRIVLTAFCDSDFLARYIRLHTMSGTSYGTMAHKAGSRFPSPCIYLSLPPCLQWRHFNESATIHSSVQ